MIGRPGSTIWLLGCELRLTWRGVTSGRRAVPRMVVLAIAGVVLLIMGIVAGLAMRHVDFPVHPLFILAADAGSLAVFTLMLSQTLAGATDALYTRGDLDLLFSSPLDPRRTLTVRFAALASSAFLAFAMLIGPFLLPVALLGHPAWLALLAVLAALAMGASGVGLALAVGLFALIGPRRTRTVAQILAAVIGAAFFLVSQTRSILGARTYSVFQQVAQTAQDPGLKLPPLADWPLRAMLGDPLPLAAMLGAGAAIFFTVTAWLSARFVGDAAAAQGADAGTKTSTRIVGAFVSGAAAATFLKEFRTLRRDVALIAQVLLRVLYLLPAAFLVLRNAGNHASYLLPGGAAVIAFLSAQVAGSLTWITLSAEEVPELIAASPARPAQVMLAKLGAGLAPLAIMLVVPLAAITWYAPMTGLAATVGAAAAAVAAGMINAWHPNPGKRSDFLRRRRSGNLATGLALIAVSLLIAAATALLAIASPFAVIPAALAGSALMLLRRTPAQVAEAMAAAS